MHLGKVNKQFEKTTGIRKERRQIESHDLIDFANPETANVSQEMFCPSREGMIPRGLTYSVRVFLITGLLWLGCVGATSAATLNQPMTGASAPGWVIGGSAYLTASNGTDPVGNGWLRLTDADPAGNEAGFGYYNSAFDISQGRSSSMTTPPGEEPARTVTASTFLAPRSISLSAPRVVHSVTRKKP